jgi:hypothetical protein
MTKTVNYITDNVHLFAARVPSSESRTGSWAALGHQVQVCADPRLTTRDDLAFRHAGRGGDPRQYAFDLFHTTTATVAVGLQVGLLLGRGRLVFFLRTLGYSVGSRLQDWSGETRARQSLTVKRAASSRRKDRECLPMLCDRPGPATNTQNPKEDGNIDLALRARQGQAIANAIDTNPFDALNSPGFRKCARADS